MSVSNALTDDCEERQLLVTQMGRTTVLNMDELDSPAAASHTSSGFVSGSHPGEDDDDLDEDMDVEGRRHRMRFEEMLRRSQEEDLSCMEDTGCVYRAGYDKQGRAVIVFIGKWFKQSQISLEKAMLYLIRTVDPVADNDYIVLYFHTRTSRVKIPSYWWIKEVYNTLTYKYKKNLKAFYVVHPTLWTKMTCWWFSTFMAPAIKNKIFNVNALEELNAVVDHQELQMPMFITEQDMVFNGLRYYKP